MLRKALGILLGMAAFSVSVTQAQRTYQIKEMLLPKVAPLTLFDPYTPGLSLGLEVKPIQQLGFQFEYNLPFDVLSFFNYNEGKLNHETQRMRGEIRYYPGRQFADKSYYLALEGFSVNEKYRRENSTLYRNGTLYNFTASDVERRVRGFALKGGYQFVVNYYLMIDIFGGLGMRQVQIAHQPTELFPTPLLFDERWGGDQREGTFNRFHLALGVRLGWSLYQRY
jgi:hypothetical protein